MIEKAKIEKPVSSDYVCKLTGVSRPALHRWSKAGKGRSPKLRKLY